MATSMFEREYIVVLKPNNFRRNGYKHVLNEIYIYIYIYIYIMFWNPKHFGRNGYKHVLKERCNCLITKPL